MNTPRRSMISGDPTHLFPECTLVASGRLGIGLTNRWDGQAYLLCSDGEALLVDTGSGRDSSAIAELIDTRLGDRFELTGIALTHGHVDHSGGAAELSDRYAVPVYGSTITADRLARGDEDAIGLTAARSDGVYPNDQFLRPVAGVQAATEITVGRLVVQARQTPGHSSDHIVYTAALPSGLAMFTGDLVFAGGRTALLNTPDTDRRAYQSSVRAMNDQRPVHLLPGHGPVVLDRGWEHLERAVAAYDQGAEPDGLLERPWNP